MTCFLFFFLILGCFFLLFYSVFSVSVVGFSPLSCIIAGLLETQAALFTYEQTKQEDTYHTTTEVSIKKIWLCAYYESSTMAYGSKLLHFLSITSLSVIIYLPFTCIDIFTLIGR